MPNEQVTQLRREALIAATREALAEQAERRLAAASHEAMRRGSGSSHIIGAAKPLRRYWVHGGDRREVQDTQTNEVVTVFSCGAGECGLCRAIEAGIEGPLCGHANDHGDRCVKAWGHAKPGDDEAHPVDAYDHYALFVEDLPGLPKLLGFDPFAPEPSPVRVVADARWGAPGCPVQNPGL